MTAGPTVPRERDAAGRLLMLRALSALTVTFLVFTVGCYLTTWFPSVGFGEGSAALIRLIHLAMIVLCLVATVTSGVLLLGRPDLPSRERLRTRPWGIPSWLMLTLLLVVVAAALAEAGPFSLPYREAGALSDPQVGQGLAEVTRFQLAAALVWVCLAEVAVRRAVMRLTPR